MDGLPHTVCAFYLSIARSIKERRWQESAQVLPLACMHTTLLIDKPNKYSLSFTMRFKVLLNTIFMYTNLPWAKATEPRTF